MGEHAEFGKVNNLVKGKNPRFVKYQTTNLDLFVVSGEFDRIPGFQHHLASAFLDLQLT